MTGLGKALLWISILVAAGSLIPAATSLTQKNRRRREETGRTFYWLTIAVCGGITLASLVLLLAFINKDFSFLYVAENSSADMGLFYRISAFWAGHEGSLLMWLWMLSGFTALIAYFKRDEVDNLNTWAIAVLNACQVFFLAVIIFAADPFRMAPVGIENGQGINPLLLHWAMIFHPPTLFVGYAGFTIPFAYAIAALMTNDSSSTWIDRSHKWTLVTWGFLTGGIFLGALWAYVVLGWGGYWGWDPVENASLLPWFTGTALIHSFTAWRQRKTLKVWTLSMAVVSFYLVLLATFITRTGVIQSVHSFGENVAMIWLFGSMMTAVMVIGFGLIIAKSKTYYSHTPMESLLSKDFTYYLNNYVMVIFMLIVLVGTAGPTFAKLLGPGIGKIIPPLGVFLKGLGKIEVKSSFYNGLARPLGMAFLMLVTLCPLLVWKKTDAAKLGSRLLYPAIATAAAAVPLFFYWRSLEAMIVAGGGKRVAQWGGYLGWLIAVFAIASIVELYIRWANHLSKATGSGFLGGLIEFFRRNRGKSGGYMAHLGVALLMVGLIGSSMFVLQKRFSVKDQPTSSFTIAGYKFSYETIRTTTAPNRETFEADFDVSDARTGRSVGAISPRVVDYKLQQQQTREVDIRRELLGLNRDIFVIFEGTDSKGNLSMHVFVNPLVSWVWLGSIVLLIGTLIACWPKAAQTSRA